MTENKELETKDNAVVLRVAKPNIQIVGLGLIAIITLFQTFQLIGISAKAGSTPLKTAPATTTPNSGGSNTDVPESIVGGC